MHTLPNDARLTKIDFTHLKLAPEGWGEYEIGNATYVWVGTHEQRLAWNDAVGSWYDEGGGTAKEWLTIDGVWYAWAGGVDELKKLLGEDNYVGWDTWGSADGWCIHSQYPTEGGVPMATPAAMLGYNAAEGEANPFIKGYAHYNEWEAGRLDRQYDDRVGYTGAGAYNYDQ